MARAEAAATKVKERTLRVGWLDNEVGSIVRLGYFDFAAVFSLVGEPFCLL